MMECDLKAVSEGEKTKAEILEACLQQMKECFLDAKLNKEKLFEAMELFFERSNRVGVNELHANGEIVTHCRVCQEADMTLKKKSDGKFLVGCLNYPHCRNVVWLPGAVSEASVTDQSCNSCGPGPVFKIRFKFRRMEIPAQYSTEHLGCIGGCDEVLRELIEICGTGPRNPSTNSARGRQAPLASRNNRSGNFRQNPCLHCGQCSHSSNECAYQLSRPQGLRSSTGTGEILCERCQTPCVLRTANTENNRGRRFFTCQSQNCNFFKWEDSTQNAALPMESGRNAGRNSRRVVGNTRANPANNRSATRGSRSSRSRREGTNGSGTFVSATGEPVTDRRCFVCGDPSHFANNCPNRGT